MDRNLALCHRWGLPNFARAAGTAGHRGIGCGAARLVERDAELAALVGALASPPALVVIAGEPGIGKTRLIREALLAPPLRGRQLLVGEAHPVRDPFPLGPALEALVDARLPRADLLSPVTGSLRGLLPERAHDLPPGPQPLDDPDEERHRTVRALVELMHALGPAVVVLEDLHWADERTVELLGLLAARPAPEVSVAITYRDTDAPAGTPLRALLGELPAALTTRLALKPLSTPAVAELAAGLLGAGVSDDLGPWLSARTAGVPFVVEEDVRLLRERGVLTERDGEWRHDGGGDAGVPAAVADAVVQRAAGLSRNARAAVDAAAVLDLRTHENLLGTVAGLDHEAAVAALAEALATRLLDERGATVGFHHALARDAIYKAIPGPRRRRLHLVAARALEGAADDAAVGLLVHHYARAGETAEWARCAEAAAELASSVGEDKTAFRYLREVLEAGAVTPARRAEVTLKLASAAPPDHTATQATIALLSQALEQPGVSRRLRGELQLYRGWLGLLEPETAPAGFADLRAVVGELVDRPDQHVRALLTLAAPWFPDTTLTEHLAYLHTGREALARTDDPEAHAHVAANGAWLLMAAGDPGAWAALDALPPPGPVASANRQLMRGLNNTADAALDLGHYVRARDIVDRTLALTGELGGERFVPFLQRLALFARWWTGDLAGVEEEVESLRGDDSVLRTDVDLIHGEILLARGALDEADAVLSSVTEENLRLGGLGRAARAGAGVVRIALARGDAAAALSLAKRILDAIAASEFWLRAAPMLPFVPIELVRDVLAAYRAGIAGRDAPLAAASLVFAEGRLAEDDGLPGPAAAVYGDATRRFAQLPDPRLVAHATEAKARCLAVVGDSRAADLYNRAWRAFADLGAPWEANRVNRAMRETGLRLPHRGGRRGFGNELSPREREVAALAAAGRTNREIAEELFLSPRTIDSHLASALRKLGINSRRGLAEALAEGER